MSDTQQGPGWWQASDGKWYPPETHPSRQAPASMPPPVPGPQIPTGHSVPLSGYSVPPTGPPAYPNAGSPGMPPTGPPGPYQQWGPGPSPYGAAMGAPYAPPVSRTNGLAIASLATAAGGIIPFFFGIPCVIGIVLGFVALSQIKRTGGQQQGRGLAIAGIVVGFALIAIFIGLISLGVATSHNTTQ
jgi:hypothetical protein